MAGHILVIDDAAINRIMLEVRLSQLSYQVGLLCSIAEIDQSQTYDAVIVAGRCLGGDVRLTLDSLRRRLKAPAPIMVLLDQGDGLTTADALEAGADDTMRRTANPAELVARLRALTRRDGFGLSGAAPLSYRGQFTEQVPHAPVLVVGANQKVATEVAHTLRAEWRGPIISSGWADATRFFAQPAPPEVVVFAVSDTDPFPAAHLLVALRAHRASSKVAILGVFDSALERHGLEVMNMGADDLYLGPIEPREVGLRIKALLRHQARVKAEQAALHQGFAESQLDPLTGLQNRRGAMPGLARESERARRNGQLLALMLADVDHFKRINDTFGHAAGDRALIEISRRLHAALPDAPVLARIGGEEFLAATSVKNADEARAIAEEMRHAISSVPVALSSSVGPIALTISVGVQLYAEGITGIETALHGADDALYAAKSDGRNRVCFSPLSAA